MSYGTGAGTSPTTNTITGGSVKIFFTFTTGTSPAAAGADICTITIPYAVPVDAFPTLGYRNAASATAGFYTPTAGTTSFVLRAATTLAASTQYALVFNIISNTGA